MTTDERAMRQGLPRRRGGDPWPVVAAGPAARAMLDSALPATLPALAARPVETASGSVRFLRRGLPRRPGGEPWPTLGQTSAAEALALPAVVPPAGGASPVRQGLPRTTAMEASIESAERVQAVEPVQPETSAAVPGARVAAAAPGSREPRSKRVRIGPFTRVQWLGALIVGGGALLVAAWVAVALARWVLSLTDVQEWLMTYPGEYHLPAGAPVGFPAWLGWQHFLNAFFMLLIIRTGLQVRGEKRPTAYWTPRWNRTRKISLALWLHQSLDVLWLLNGVTFVVVLFVSGQWMRVVPTSWAVFPNALSAALQYLSLDWPTENGWVNYNALQQLAYFTTVFVAAPLSIITGVRMSGIWPKNANALNRIYPIEWARKVHFPVMLYFVAFIVVHVALVLSTGALRNLNHMYAAQGSTDPAAFSDNWAGFWIFVASMVVLAAAWIAARPLVLAPIARLFGTVGRS